MYTDFEVLPNGNLKISLNKNGKDDLIELKEKHEKIGTLQIWWELNEGMFTNGYSEIQPEQIGALTSAPIISDGFIDEETTKEEFKQTKFWWFPNYMVIDEVAELFEKGFVIFDKVN